MDNNFSCGIRIKQLRNEKQLTQEWVALEADITPAYLGLIERGKRNPTVTVIEKICGVMDISLSEFFDLSVAPDKETSTLDRQIIAQISNLTEDEKRDFLNIVKSIMQFRKDGIHPL